LIMRANSISFHEYLQQILSKWRSLITKEN
jgi:hypothetical protein